MLTGVPSLSWGKRHNVAGEPDTGHVAPKARPGEPAGEHASVVGGPEPVAELAIASDHESRLRAFDRNEPGDCQ
jgi:hypothetical protein